MDPAEITGFWLDEIDPAQWWKKDVAFDDGMRRRFGAVLRAALQGDCEHWVYGADAHAWSALAYVILLDQFPRNIYRDWPEAFAQDPRALAASKHAVSRDWHDRIDRLGGVFMILPLEHSESLADQAQCLRLMKPLSERFEEPAFLDAAQRHYDVIARFGRFPHRNAILGRPSTPEEEEFLKEPGSRF